MLIPSFEEIEKIADSRYALVILVSKRAKLIVDGNRPFEKTKSNKPVSIAMKEAVKGDIVFGERMTNREYAKKVEEEKERKLNILREEKLEEITEIMEDAE